MKLFGKKETKSYIYSDSTLKILKDIFTWANTTIGFTNPEFNELLRYYSTNSVVYGLIATQIGRAMEELSEVVEIAASRAGAKAEQTNDDVVEDAYDVDDLI